MRKTSFIVGLFLLAAGALWACSSGGTTQQSVRWVPYTGCNAAQCKSWFEECNAECINQHQMGTTECENKCRANVPNCESSCSGG